MTFKRRGTCSEHTHTLTVCLGVLSGLQHRQMSVENTASCCPEEVEGELIMGLGYVGQAEEGPRGPGGMLTVSELGCASHRMRFHEAAKQV